MLGSKLHAMTNPESVEVRLKALERKSKRSGRVSIGSNNPDHSQRGGLSPVVPIIDTADITLTTTLDYSKEGIAKPRINVVVAPEFEEIVRWTPCFAGYSYRVISPDGEVSETKGSVILDAAGIHPVSPNLRSLPSNPFSDATQGWVLQMKVNNTRLGDGEWSAELPFTVSEPALALPSPSAPTLTGKFGTITVSFTPPDKTVYPTYRHTEIWVGNSTFPGPGNTGTKKGESKTGYFEFNWDEVSDVFGSITAVKIRHVDMSNNVTGMSPKSDITSGMRTAALVKTAHIDDLQITTAKLGALSVTNAKLGTITDPSKFQLWTGSSNYRGIYDVGGTLAGQEYDNGFTLEYKAVDAGHEKGVRLMHSNSSSEIKLEFGTTGDAVMSAGSGAGEVRVKDDATVNVTGTLILNSGTPIAKYLRGSGTVDFSSIPANSTTELGFTLTGAAVGDTVIITPSGVPESGLVWSGIVKVADSVHIRMANVTNGTIDPASRTWYASLTKH